MVQYGLSEDSIFYEFSKDRPQPSAWDKFPTSEDPLSKYKYVSLELVVGLDKVIINRESYSLLDYLGDLGGLIDALYYICYTIVAPVASFSMKATLLSKIFRFKPKKQFNPDELNQSAQETAKSFLSCFYRKTESKQDKLTIVKTILKEF